MDAQPVRTSGGPGVAFSRREAPPGACTARSGLREPAPAVFAPDAGAQKLRVRLLRRCEPALAHRLCQRVEATTLSSQPMQPSVMLWP